MPTRVKQTLDFAVDKFQQLLESRGALWIVADRARFRVEGCAILLVGANVAPFEVAVIRIIVGAHRHVFDDTWGLILHCEHKTLVVDREIDPPQV